MITRRKLIAGAVASLMLPRQALAASHGIAPQGLKFNLILDSSWTTSPGAPSDYQASLATAISLLQAAYPSVSATLNMHVGYTTQWLSPSIPASPIGPSSSIGTILGVSLISYPTIRAAMAALAVQSTSLAANLANLPTTSSLNGQSSFDVSSSSAKVLALFGFSGGPTGPNDPMIDGSVGIGSGWATAKQVGVFLHEFTHAMYRETGIFAPFVFSRFTSTGTRDFTTNTSAYFSLDNGATNLVSYDSSQDFADFSNSSSFPLDCLNAIQANGANQFLSTIDNKLLNSGGFQ